MLQKTLKKVRWGLRKLNLPVRMNDLVLEVGSGGNPHPYADVLLEKFIDNGHRLIGVKLDRFSVLADACQMPFASGAFDYSLAYHVLEHVKTPELFIAEMTRVSKAGYIETPNVFYERCHPFDVHVLELLLVGQKLLIRNKTDFNSDPFLASADMFQKNRDWKRFFETTPEAFHVCLKWKGSLDFEIVNPDTDLDWFVDPPAGFIESEGGGADTSGSVRGGGRGAVLNMARKAKKTLGRQNVDYKALLVCPLTHQPLYKSADGTEFVSPEGGYAYPVKNDVPVLLPNDARALTAV